jgi:hypothetical protein
MKRFGLWYWGLLGKSLGTTFTLWGHDWSGRIAVILAVIAIIGSYCGVTWLAGANEVANWLLGVATIAVLLGTLVVGPLIMAYRQYVKGEEDKKRLEEEKESLLKPVIVFSIERMRYRVKGGTKFHYSTAIYNTSQTRTVKRSVT